MTHERLNTALDVFMDCWVGACMTDNVIPINKDRYEIEYVFDDDKIVGVTHPSWPFRIMRNGNKIAFVCEDTDEPFGELDGDIFNTVLMCWMLIDDPSLVDGSRIDD